jgi:hypothetical protein
MRITEAINDNILEITDGTSVLSIPVTTWGHPGVLLDNNRIPAARIWAEIGNAMKEGKQADRAMLLYEAKRAEVFRQTASACIVYTTTPLPGDQGIMDQVYARAEPQRFRPLVDRYKIKIAKSEEGFSPEIVAIILEACECLGLYPVGMADERAYFCKDPEEVFAAFGSRNFLRVAILLRRPGSSSEELDLD